MQENVNRYEDSWQRDHHIRKKTIKKGSIFTEEDLHMLSPGDGLKWADRDKIIGKKAKQDIAQDEIIYPNLIE